MADGRPKPEDSMTIDQDDCIRSPLRAAAAHSLLNNRGEGFDPTGDIDGWELVYEARTTDEVSVYRHTDDEGDFWVYLVGTDGSGSDDSRWATRVGDVGVEA